MATKFSESAARPTAHSALLVEGRRHAAASVLVGRPALVGLTDELRCLHARAAKVTGADVSADDTALAGVVGDFLKAHDLFAEPAVLELVCRVPQSTALRRLYAECVHGLGGPAGWGERRADFISVHLDLYDLPATTPGMPLAYRMEYAEQRQELARKLAVLFAEPPARGDGDGSAHAALPGYVRAALTGVIGQPGTGRGGVPEPVEYLFYQDGTPPRVTMNVAAGVDAAGSLWNNVPILQDVLAPSDLVLGPARLPPWGFLWRRGFIDQVSCRVRDWLSWGPHIVGRQPVAHAVLHDAHPEPSPAGLRDGADRELFYVAWFRAGQRGAFVTPAVLPDVLFNLLGSAGRLGSHRDTARYQNRTAALAALATACLLYARTYRFQPPFHDNEEYGHE